MKRLFALLIVAGFCLPALAADKVKPTPEEAFKKMDANNDKLVSKEEYVGKKKDDKLTAAEKKFKKLDKNSDGSLNLDEFKAAEKKGK